MEAATNQLPKNIVNPFSEAFLDSWLLWKNFRWEQHKFKYKGCISEQAALMRLTTVAGGQEETAVQIIHQSIANGWKDFYMLKNNGNGQQGKPGNGNGSTTLRSDVQAEFEKRYSNRG